MQIGGGGGTRTGDSSSKSWDQSTTRTRSQSAPELFGPGKIFMPEQRKAIQTIAPSLIEQAMAPGFTKQETARKKKEASEDLTRETAASFGNLRDIFATSGIRGGVNKEDIGDVMESAMLAKGKAFSDIRRAGEAASVLRKNRLLSFLDKTPFALGQKSSGFTNVDAWGWSKSKDKQREVNARGNFGIM